MLLLQTEGHQAKGVGTAAAAWNVIRGFDPDVVLLDIGLPDKSGYDHAREFRRWYGALRPVIIAVTGWNQGSDKILSHIAAADHPLAQPYHPHLLPALP